MSRLLKVEIRRLLSRRLLWVLAAVLLAGLVVAMGQTAYGSRPPSPQEIAEAEAAVAREARTVDIEQVREDCLRAEAEAREQGSPEDFECDQIRPPRAEDFLGDRIFRFAPQMPGRLVPVAVVLTLLGFVVGASFVGAEWAAGTMAHLLIWEPRRLRVLVAKTVALALVLVGLGVVITAVALAGHFAVAATRGDLTGTTAGVWQSLGLRALRASALGAFAGLVGMSIAGALRHTAAALGVAFAYFLGGEVAIRAIWTKSETWLLSSNVGAWTENGLRIERPDCPRFGGECRVTVLHVSLAEGAIFLGVLLAVLLAVFAVTFRRRDVT
jgi:ABC-2 type transport system permease protein